MNKKTLKTLYVCFLTTMLILIYACEQKQVIEEPKITTTDISELTQTSVKAGGIIDNDGGSEIVSYGVCWSMQNNPTIEDHVIIDSTHVLSFESQIQALQANTTYYLRAFASNEMGITYGNEVSFTTLAFNYYTVSDIDGNEYNAIQIGEQHWFTENLKTTRYANGDIIPDGTGINRYDGLKSYWFAYEHDLNNVATYGRLYTWLTIVDNRNVCPDGWHVPTDTDWETLINYTGGAELAGRKLKENGTEHWKRNKESTNEYGFRALPGGYFYPPAHANFANKEYLGYWWSSSEVDETTANHFYLNGSSHSIYQKSWKKEYCFSVRCVKD